MKPAPWSSSATQHKPRPSLTRLALCGRLRRGNATAHGHHAHTVPAPGRQALQAMAASLSRKGPVGQNGAGLVQQLQPVAVIDAGGPLPADGQTVRRVVVVRLQGGDSGGSCSGETDTENEAGPG